MNQKERDSLTDPDGRSLSYQGRAPALSKRFDRIARSAVRRLGRDMEALLETFAYQGGFRTRAEARAFLKRPISPSTLDALVDQLAELTDKRTRNRILTRLGRAAYDFRMTRMEAVNMTIETNKTILTEALVSGTSPILLDVVDEAYGRQSFTLQKQIRVGFSVKHLPANQMNVLFNSPLTSSSSWFAKGVSDRLRDVLMESLMTGKGIKDISKDLEKMEIPASSSKMVARTILTEVSNEAEMKALKDSSVKRYEYVATLDERTCPVCGRLDGKTFKLEDAKKGVNLPPMHPNCRCVHIASLTKDVKEDLTRIARDERGKTIYVPADMTYDEWKKLYYTGKASKKGKG